MSNNSSKPYGGTSVDRSKLKILLCDHDSESSQEVFNLLNKCCYQVISVSSAVEVVNALNSEGLYIDLIQAGVDLPVDTSMKMLKYIMHNKNFRYIPVISKTII
ncbi:hypothetical protein FNV43_RR05816 [Rhamnella rubrinervis]|uniref:Response regulatory domain-containing protein n=1 Tax=Rhamnella rubrinervis TaxID=2594499 RepID=A0A8K0HMU6_9ROSA|nr:hypothetical protein FNV43_RR05816 [Rhamnella rubrinervis]